MASRAGEARSQNVDRTRSGCFAQQVVRSRSLEFPPPPGLLTFTVTGHEPDRAQELHRPLCRHLRAHIEPDSRSATEIVGDCLEAPRAPRARAASFGKLFRESRPGRDFCGWVIAFCHSVRILKVCVGARAVARPFVGPGTPGAPCSICRARRL